jgi:osmotically-inducible protein OsmY
MRAPVNSRPPKDTQMTNDQNLKQSVLDELNWEPSINSASIGVTAKDGVVTLTGNVETFSQKHAAELAALRVHAIKAVAEEIEVKLPFDVKHGDAEIAEAALHRLAWDSLVPKDAVKVTVADGWLTLTGQVNNWSERELAGATAWSAPGVSSVTNDIRVR